MYVVRTFSTSPDPLFSIHVMGFHFPRSLFRAGFVASPSIARAGGAHVVSRGNAALSFSGAVAGKRAGRMMMAAPETYTVVVVWQVV